MKQLVAISKNRQAVFLDEQTTNVTLHIMEAPRLLEYVKELIECEVIDGDNVALEKDMGRTIGEMSLVETTERDEIVYAKRLHRDKFTRFAKNRQPTPTNWLTVIVREIDGEYILWSAWCGQLVPTSPGEDEMPKSRGFWASHALVYDEKIIQPGTETNLCPWE